MFTYRLYLECNTIGIKKCRCAVGIDNWLKNIQKSFWQCFNNF